MAYHSKHSSQALTKHYNTNPSAEANGVASKLTHGVDIGEAGSALVGEGVLELRAAGELVQHVDDGGGDLVHGAVVGGGGAQDLVQQGADDSGVVALGVADRRGGRTVGGCAQERNAACREGSQGSLS